MCCQRLLVSLLTSGIMLSGDTPSTLVAQDKTPNNPDGLRRPVDPYPTASTRVRSGSRTISSLPVRRRFEDPTFDRYVDISQVGYAITSLDAELLTDLALQFAQGERVLLRKHRSGVTASDLLKRAFAMASVKGDQITQERLKKAVVSIGDKELSNEFAASEKLRKASRGTDDATVVPLDGFSGEDLVHMKWYVSAITRAVVTNDKGLLEELQLQIQSDTSLSRSTRSILLKRIDRAREQLGVAGPQDAVIRQLERDHWYGRIDPLPQGTVEGWVGALQGHSRDGTGQWLRNKIQEERQRQEKQNVLPCDAPNCDEPSSVSTSRGEPSQQPR